MFSSSRREELESWEEGCLVLLRSVTASTDSQSCCHGQPSPSEDTHSQGPCSPRDTFALPQAPSCPSVHSTMANPCLISPSLLGCLANACSYRSHFPELFLTPLPPGSLLDLTQKPSRQIQKNLESTWMVPQEVRQES